MSIDDIEFSMRKSLELDIYEIDEKLNSEIPLELQYYIGNLLSLLRTAIEKLKVSLILPKILENPRVLQQYLKNTKYCKGLKLVQEYRNRRNTESSEEFHLGDYHLLQIIDYFQENFKILHTLPDWLDDIDQTEKDLLMAFEDVYQVAQERFRRAATVVLAKEKQLHKVYLANEEIKRNINDTLRRIETKRLNRRWKTSAKSAVTKHLEDEVSHHQHNNKMLVKGEILASHRQIQHINNALATRQLEFEEELNKARLTFQTKLTTDVVNEKNIRDERNKLQLQLQALIKKYDQTMSDKYAEEILLQKEYEKEKQIFDKLLMEYRKQEELMLQREKEHNSSHEDKIILFRYKRAAKRIQRWWKKLLWKKRGMVEHHNTKDIEKETDTANQKKSPNAFGTKGRKKK